MQNEPINNIQWIDVDQLSANDYNPNVVFNDELKLLEFSILKNGWIQPILVSKDNVIIDGFHRFSLSCQSKKLREKYNGKVPCVVMDISEAERMLLTIRINRAKGSHIAFKMAEIVIALVDKHGMTLQEIGENIGADKEEVVLLYENSIFKKKDLQNKEYSKAWKPK